MKLIIDRFEGRIAVCETESGGYVDIPREMLPQNVREGSVVIENSGVYEEASDETASRRKRISELLNGLMKG